MKPPIEITQTTRMINLKGLRKFLKEISDDVIEQLEERKTNLTEPQRYRVSVVVTHLNMLD